MPVLLNLEETMPIAVVEVMDSTVLSNINRVRAIITRSMKGLTFRVLPIYLTKLMVSRCMSSSNKITISMRGKSVTL